MRTHHVFLPLFIAITCVYTPAQATTYIGYTGKPWSNDYGLIGGECKAEQLRARIENGQIAQAANLQFGEAMEQIIADNAEQPASKAIDSLCFGYSLELVPAGQRIHWVNPINDVTVHLLLGNESDTCRLFSVVTINATTKKRFRGQACTATPGNWEVKNLKPL